MQPGPKIYAEHPEKTSALAIRPLAGGGGAAPANFGEPAALPAGQAARLGQGLT
jgi:hypothetical protein